MKNSPIKANNPQFVDEINASLALATQGVVKASHVVEMIHARINYQVFSLLGLKALAKDKEKTQGISRLVYNSIRNLSQGSGFTLALALSTISSRFPQENKRLMSLNTQSALNGILGDYLHQTKNTLAISMQFKKNGQPISPEDWLSLLKKSQGKILLLVHGLCMNDQQWNMNGYDHGEYLAEKLGYEVVYLQYNSGLHISENGQQLASLLEELMSILERHSQDETLTFPALEISILAHSMGGLVTRSACYYAHQKSHNWIEYLKKFICLGTPHHGSAWERVGHQVDQLLNTNSYSRPIAMVAKMRSAGITDLRYGNIVEQDWRCQDEISERFGVGGDQRQPIPLPEGVLCYQLAAVKGSFPKSRLNKWIADELIGDGLVSVKSALGQHQDKSYQLESPEQHFKIIPQTNHMELLNSAEVSHILETWLN